MKNKLHILAAFAMLVFFGQVQTIHAVPVTGEINLSGGTAINGPSFEGATGLDFLEWNGSSYAANTPGGSFTVAAVSGNFADYITPSPFILGNINDFEFNSPSPNSLWNIGGFFFDLTSVSVDRSVVGQLRITGLGQLYGNGFDSTLTSMNLVVTKLLTTHSWYANFSTDVQVPEATSLIMFALGLLGLGIFSRRK